MLLYYKLKIKDHFAQCSFHKSSQRCPKLQFDQNEAPTTIPTI